MDFINEQLILWLFRSKSSEQTICYQKLTKIITILISDAWIKFKMINRFNLQKWLLGKEKVNRLH